MSITGAPEGEPTKPGLPISDLSAGLYAFGAILAALRGRDAAAGAAASGTRGGAGSTSPCTTRRCRCWKGRRWRILASGQAPPRIGNAHYAIAPFDTFRAQRPAAS